MRGSGLFYTLLPPVYFLKTPLESNYSVYPVRSPFGVQTQSHHPAQVRGNSDTQFSNENF